MSGLKLNLLMIVCWLTGLIILDVKCDNTNHMPDPITVTLPDPCEINAEKKLLFMVTNINKFDLDVTLNTSITHFKLSKHDNNNNRDYEIRMNETVEDINIFLSSEDCNCPMIQKLTESIYYKLDCSNQTLNTCLNNNCWKTSVKLQENCRNATYEGSKCRQSTKQSRFILKLNKKNEQYLWTCVDCKIQPDTPCKRGNKTACMTTPESTLNLTKSVDSKGGHIKPSNASDALDSLESQTEWMKNNNKTSVAIVMDDTIGVLHIPDENTDSDFCYSSNQNMMNIVDCLSDLSADFPWSVMIPSEAFDKARLENNGSAFVGILRFHMMGNENETTDYTILNNETYGITMGAIISNLNYDIEMFFTHNDLVGNAHCSSWDGKGKLEWTTFGCETEKINNNTIKCSCSHLTFFAVLMSPDIDSNSVAPYLESLTLISSIGCGISAFFLAIALFMHFLLRKAKSNQATKILINMFVALFLLNVSFLSNESVANTENKGACVFIAMLMHYSMLTTFTWFFIQALHMYLWLIRQNVTITNYMRKITVLGWVFSAPVVIVVVSLGGYSAVSLTASSGKIAQMCWIKDPFIHYIVNTGYYIFVFIFTLGIFITILSRIVQVRRMRATDGKRRTFRKQLMLVLSLFVLFGLTWAVAFFSYGPMLIPSYYTFSVLNSFQGFFLFLYYYHIHKDVEGRFTDDPRSTGSTTTIVPPNIYAAENVYSEAQ